MKAYTLPKTALPDWLDRLRREQRLFAPLADLDRVVEEARAHLDDFEQHNDRFGVFEFAVKKHDIDRSRLVVVAFVQDEESKEVLQAAQVRLGGRARAGH